MKKGGKSMKLLFKGGTLISGSGREQLDLLIEDEKISAVGKDLEETGAEVVDVSGKFLFPGFIDAHTHMALEVSGTITADKFETGTKAELAGGTTCIVDYATQYPGESLKEALWNWHKKADGNASCDYAFHLALTDWNDGIRKELEPIVREELCSFKLYMTYDTMVDDETMYEILVRLKELGGIAGVHCENNGIIQARLKEVERIKGNRADVSDYPWTRPAEAEAEAVSRLLKIAKCADAPVIVVHLSTAAGYREIERAREAGQTVYVETCPQYLVLDNSRYSLAPEKARAYMIAPPLRTKEDQEVLWQALKNGGIQTIATDHCSFTMEQKQTGEGDFAKTPCGMPGAETRPAIIWQEGVREGRITAEQMCRYLAENPARLYQLYPRKGVLAPGSDADLVVWNPETEWKITAQEQQSACDYCPVEGMRISGQAESVYLRGKLAAEHGKVLEENTGIYICHGNGQKEG